MTFLIWKNVEFCLMLELNFQVMLNRNFLQLGRIIFFEETHICVM